MTSFVTRTCLLKIIDLKSFIDVTFSLFSLLEIVCEVKILQCAYDFCGSVSAGKIGGGFGIGALEDLGDEDEDVYNQGRNIPTNSSSFSYCIHF